MIMNVVSIIKQMIKERMPAKPKYFALLLLKELMATKNSFIVDYFAKKLMMRCFRLATYKSKEKEYFPRGEDCLNRYYSQKSQENRKYSKMFYFLLLECWKHWHEMFASKNKKIRSKS